MFLAIRWFPIPHVPFPRCKEEVRLYQPFTWPMTHDSCSEHKPWFWHFGQSSYPSPTVCTFQMNNVCHLILFRKPLAMPFAYDMQHLVAAAHVQLHVFYPSGCSFIPKPHARIHLPWSLPHHFPCVVSCTDGKAAERTWALSIPLVEMGKKRLHPVQYRACL